MVTFTACRSKPELVLPARATPREVRSLSDVDRQPILRSYTTVIEFFRCLVPGGAPAQPASSLKAGLAEALVHYYPVAGRLRELPVPHGKKLVVDCTAEGVVFVEAHANVRLEEFAMPLVPPYPCVDELVCDVGDAGAIVGKPLLYLQMTQLRCGGIVLALTMCHSVVDAFGLVQIFRFILDLARGEAQPAVLPSWERHLLTSSFSPEAAAMAEEAAHDGSSEAQTSSTPAPPPPLDEEEMVTRSFLFGPREVAVLRSGVQARLGRSSTVFELITAAVWRCRAAALEHASHDRVSVWFLSNARGSWKRDPPLPPGFYGNAPFIARAEAAAGELQCGGGLARAVELVHEAKLRVTDEHVRSVLDLMARGEYRVDPDLDRTFLVSDITRCGDDSLNLGCWAERVGGGTPGLGPDHGFARSPPSLFMSYKDANGDVCVVVPMCLPETVMARFASQIAALTNVPIARSSM
ncbi:transferase family expressed [Hordeum vulgare]|nr:transferase family expressed [Hordeum vulgare]